MPFFIGWDGQIPVGAYDHPVTSLDVLPTCLAAAGVRVPADKPVDGVNLIPYLIGKQKTPPHAALYWKAISERAQKKPWAAVRAGQWKLHLSGNRNLELYDLNADIGERTDLARKHPEIAKKLLDMLDGWQKSLA